ncbi:hypothetical protein KL930_000650 [Ogataea haglerorum]|nr:hypothetical protein KL932_000689 [Ogataea haglerorum]KAG7781545.1 hypothetical protein KL922_000467 [Ogataea haglerorum]KAG7782188.1 hypothetical protein KL930_000650 [Ogataea haglerorum]
MSAAQQLIAHYLKTNNLTRTLAAFELELNRKFDYYSVEESLETILKDRLAYLSLEKPESENTKSLWTVDVPKKHDLLDLGTLKSLVISSCFVKLEIGSKSVSLGLFVTNNKQVHFFDLEKRRNILVKNDLHGLTATKLVAGVDGSDLLFSCGMDGKLRIWRAGYDNELQLELLSEKQLHKRLVLQMKFQKMDRKTGFLVSTGWDSKLVATRVNLEDGTTEKLNEVSLLTRASCLLITADSSNYPVILVGRTDTSMVGVYTIHDSIFEIGRVALNDSEFSSHSFHPMAFAKTENDTVVAATNHTPYMRLITFKIPTIADLIGVEETEVAPKVAAASVLASDSESFQTNVTIRRNIIISNFNSMSPQDKFSDPIVRTRPHKDGVWIFGDDGVVRGFDVGTGSVVEELKTHEGRIKSAFVADVGDTETIVSCGAVDRVASVWQ